MHAVGPDRAAAEWILRLGGAVRFSGLVDSWSTDYNRIPSGELRLQAIDASALSITNNGLEHLSERGRTHTHTHTHEVVATFTTPPPYILCVQPASKT